MEVLLTHFTHQPFFIFHFSTQCSFVLYLCFCKYLFYVYESMPVLSLPLNTKKNLISLSINELILLHFRLNQISQVVTLPLITKSIEIFLCLFSSPIGFAALLYNFVILDPTNFEQIKVG